MTDYSLDSVYTNSDMAMHATGKYVCAVCEREIHSGEACYCFEDMPVCENCCNEFVMDHYWYATPEDI